LPDRLSNAYRDHVFGTTGLKDLPDAPRFIFNATNLQTGALWRFSKPYMADYKVGVVCPTLRSNSLLRWPRRRPSPRSSPQSSSRSIRVSWDPTKRGPLHEPPYTTKPVLSDGGVYDNLGLETAWKR
jgi:NTE family protein